MISEKYTECDLYTANEQKTFGGDDGILRKENSMDEVRLELIRCIEGGFVLAHEMQPSI